MATTVDRVRVVRDRKRINPTNPSEGFVDSYVVQGVDGPVATYPYTPEGKAAAKADAARINSEV